MLLENIEIKQEGNIIIIPEIIVEDDDIKECINIHLESLPDNNEEDDYIFTILNRSDVTVKIKPLIEINKFAIPYKGSKEAGCMDVKIVNIELIKNEETSFIEQAIIGLGFATEIPKGWRGVILPRSSLSNFKWVMQNTPSIIDSDYRGEWTVKMRPLKTNTTFFPFSIGDRIAQVYFEKINSVDFIVTDELNETKRNNGGYGSTGM